jgi:hypothetical protein
VVKHTFREILALCAS